jgi:hypothetical protein
LTISRGEAVACREDMDSQRALLHGDVTDKVIGAFFDTYNELAGFPEFVLRRAMAIAIRERGLAEVEEKQLRCRCFTT